MHELGKGYIKWEYSTGILLMQKNVLGTTGSLYTSQVQSFYQKDNALPPWKETNHHKSCDLDRDQEDFLFLTSDNMTDWS